MHGHIDAFAQHQVSFAVVDEFSDAAAGEQRHDLPVCVPRYFALQKVQQFCVLVQSVFTDEKFFVKTVIHRFFNPAFTCLVLGIAPRL